MVEGGGRLPADVDSGGLSAAILEAAYVARIGVTITLIEPPQPRCIYVNEAAAEIVGWPVDVLLERSPFSHVAPEDLDVVRQGFNRRVEGDRGKGSYELDCIRSDGSRATIEVTTSSVTVGGKPAVFAFVVDVTARKNAERAKLRSEASFRELIELAPEPIGIVGGETFLYANAAYARVLGHTSAVEMYARRLDDYVVPEQRALLRTRFEFMGDGGRLPPIVYRVRRVDGVEIQLEASSIPYEYEGRPSVLTMARDVTARKKLEAQLVQADRLAAIGTMAAGVAHEINNPLSYVMLNLDWIARKLPESARDPESMSAMVELLREAHRGAERVAGIVRELRTFSRADGETRRRVDLASVVQSAIRLAGHEIRHRARISTTFEVVGAVWANESRLEQVVLNLLLNAAHAMREDQVATNEIRIIVRADGPDRVLLEVTDNGEGIPAEVIPRIFDPFFTTKPRGVGVGLGLSICHGIVTALGGQITVQSLPGAGTSFRVLLPTTLEKDADPAQISEVPSAQPLARRARILVVDDELPIVTTMRELLGASYDVVATTSAQEALATIAASPPAADFDVVFCDLMMPGMNGMDFYEGVLASRPALAARIVFMTGGAFTARAAEFLASIDNGRIEKPFSLGLIDRIVREMARTNGTL